MSQDLITMSQDLISHAIQVLIGAILVPIGLVASYGLIRALAWLRAAAGRAVPAPVAVHPLNFEHSIKEFVDGQGVDLLELPSKVRDYLARESTNVVRLAPGPVVPVTPPISSASPDGEAAPSTLSAQVASLFRPRRRPTINIILVPEIIRDTGFSVGVQLVRHPQDTLVGARSIRANDIKELAYKVGGFCAEQVLDLPEFRRRSPRWEHWTPQAYTLFRIGLYFQRHHDLGSAHHRLTDAARRCPGNVQLALFHGNVHEKLHEYDKAVEVYDAAACLWVQNIDLSYRLAGARANQALTFGHLSIEEKSELMEQANRGLESARKRLRKRAVLLSFLRTLHPLRRDPGERRYWWSWLQSDPSRRPASLFRRSKGFELRRALEVAVEANRLYLCNLQYSESRKDELRGIVRSSWKSACGTVERGRVGWLTHWTAACFFSRASSLRTELRLEDEWHDDWDATGSLAEIGLGGGHRPTSWATYCQERAVGEIGRVVRNPYCALDFSLLRDDPDMKPLRKAFRGRSVAVLAGIDDETLDEDIDIPMQRASDADASAAGTAALGEFDY